MTREELIEFFNETFYYLKFDRLRARLGYQGICLAFYDARKSLDLPHAVRNQIQYEFDRCFHADGGYLFGRPHESNLKKREIALTLFKEYCLSEHFYESISD